MPTFTLTIKAPSSERLQEVLNAISADGVSEEAVSLNEAVPFQSAISLEKIAPTPRKKKLDGTWGQWRRQHWGVPWDVEGHLLLTLVNLGVIEFESDMLPAPAIETLAEIYPDCKFRVERGSK